MARSYLPNGAELKIEMGVARYKIVQELAMGGFGITYRATDMRLNRAVVIKEFFPDGCTRNGEVLAQSGENTVQELENAVKSFEKEGITLASLEHPNIVKVYDFFMGNRTAYLVLEYIDGRTLAQVFKSEKTPFPHNEALDIVRQMASALRYIHQKSVIHRDMNYSNVMLKPDGQAVLIDFGLARKFGATQNHTLTQGFFDGFTPPEEYDYPPSTPHPRRDVYGLSALLYWMLTGEAPLGVPTRLRRDSLVPPHEKVPSVPYDLSMAVMEGLKMREEDRYQTIAELESAINSAERDIWIPERPIPIAERALGWIRRVMQGAEEVSEETAEGVTKTTPPTARLPTSAPPLRPVARVITPIEPPKMTRNPKDGAEIIYIPAGKFLMGDSDMSHNLRHEVELTDYYIYKNLVTVGQYATYCKAERKDMPPSPDFNANWSNKNHPIVNVAWEEAQAYAKWAGGNLPSEAQWERAARGTDGRKYPWGDEFDRSKCWCSKKSWGDSGGTTTVGKYGVSPDGCTDMAGNVWQWCLDGYDANLWNGKSSQVINPVNVIVKVKRVLHGGSWYNVTPDYFRCASRYKGTPGGGNSSLGFRVALRGL